MNRAALLRPKIKNVPPASIVHFKFSQARVADSNRNFIDAARKYYDVSTTMDVAPEEQMVCLKSAVTCVILAPAGPKRSQVLRLIYSDDRTRQLPDFGILENYTPIDYYGLRNLCLLSKSCNHINEYHYLMELVY